VVEVEIAVLDPIRELVKLESVVVDPLELVLPPNWASMATEMIATAITATNKVNRFPGGLVIGYRLPFRLSLPRAFFGSYLMRQ